MKNNIEKAIIGEGSQGTKEEIVKAENRLVPERSYSKSQEGKLRFHPSDDARTSKMRESVLNELRECAKENGFTDTELTQILSSFRYSGRPYGENGWRASFTVNGVEVTSEVELGEYSGISDSYDVSFPIFVDGKLADEQNRYSKIMKVLMSLAKADDEARGIYK